MAYLSPFAKPRGVIQPSSADVQRPSSPPMAPAKCKQPLERKTLSRTKPKEGRIAGSTSKKDLTVASTSKVKAGRITKNTSTPLANAQSQKRKSFFWSLPIVSSFFSPRPSKKDEEDLDGDTYVEDEDEGAKTTPSHDTEYTLLVEDYDEGIKDTGRTLTSYKDKAPHRDYITYKEWSSEEIWMFNKLANRGREPLLKETWAYDFPSFPEDLFARDQSKAIIDNIHTSDWRASFQLISLVGAGSRCRDRLLNGNLPPEPILGREIKAYHKWSLRDGKLDRKPHIPLIVIGAAKGSQSVESIVTRVTDRLHSLGKQYQDKWRHPDCKEEDQPQIYTHAMPTLYGFVLKYSVLAIVTYDASVPKKAIRTLGTFDWKDGTQDVWHALAVAIVMVRARDHLLQLEREGELGEEIPLNSDPDL